MHVKLKREAFAKIDSAFKVLKEDPNNNAAVEILSDTLKESFDLNFTIAVIPVENIHKPLFVMSVYPEISTVEKIVSHIMSGDRDYKAIEKLWVANKSWTIEIDQRILMDSVINLSDRELTAILLHEIGHIACSNSIPRRLHTVFRYEIISHRMKNKILVKDKVFRDIMALPILNACVADDKKDTDTVKEELLADNYVKKMGYRSELLSALSKFSKHPLYPKTTTKNQSIKITTDKSMEVLDQIQKRQDNLVKKTMFHLKENCLSPYMGTVIHQYYDMLFESVDDSLTLSNDEKLQKIMDKANTLVDESYLREFLIFGTKKMRPLSVSEIDYVEIKVNTIQTEDDKMMLLTYLHNKLDMVEYYLDILNDKKMKQKYSIPHTTSELEAMKKRLIMLRQRIMAVKIPTPPEGYIVQYPEGFEG